MKNYPIAKKKPKILIAHNHERIDNYYWLKDKKNPEVIDYLAAENAYTKEILEPNKKLEQILYEEMTSKIVKDDDTVPYEMNGYWYYTRHEKDRDYPIYCRKEKNLDNDEYIMLDVNDIAKKDRYCFVDSLAVSLDNTMLCYGVDIDGSDTYTIYFKNLKTDITLPHTIVDTCGSIVWANDNKTIYYTKLEEKTLRIYKIFKYTLGEEREVEVYYEKDNTFEVYVSKTKSNKYILIESKSTLSTETQILDADTPHEAFQLFSPREDNVEYSIEHCKDRFFILTNDHAENFKIMTSSIKVTNKKEWKNFIGHREDVFIEEIEIFNQYLVLQEKQNALTHICIYDLETNASYYLDFMEDIYAVSIGENREMDSERLQYKYSSMITPPSVLAYNMKTKESKILKETKVLGGFDKDLYVSKRLWATAKDGAKMPISLLYKKGLTLDGNNPLLQYGYGAYGASIPTSFNLESFSLVDRGFVYAIAHVRGGEELGRGWYEQGRLRNKINTFTDFIACSEFLITQGYSSKKKIFAQGASAGGLLMGAISNMRPDLYSAIVAEVPFVDIVTTMLDDTIPLSTLEYDEWGNPHHKEDYDYMLRYSPYDNIEKKAYPHMFVISALNDTSVQYFEPTKWVAKLRDYKRDNNVLLLHININSGHFGDSGRFEIYKELAMIYGFILSI